jgi:DNA polymerase elongation subunit (family B)
MARLAHTQGYLLVSAGREAVARQPAMEALPLVMEPRSRLYTDPLVVLDFQVWGGGCTGVWGDRGPGQWLLLAAVTGRACGNPASHSCAPAPSPSPKENSHLTHHVFRPPPNTPTPTQSLYPSMIIAYNLCFSTCLGRPAHAAAGAAAAAAAGGPLPRLGIVDYGLPPGTLAGALCPDRLVVAPNGVAFAPREARPGVLPRLLSEILNTRIMVCGCRRVGGGVRPRGCRRARWGWGCARAIAALLYRAGVALLHGHAPPPHTRAARR